MSRHAKDFETRKASAMETARWLLPEIHRAIERGYDKVELSVRDVKEVLAFLEASAQREKVQFAGKRLGFADPEMMRDLMSRRRASSPVLFKQTPRYCVEVFYVELPPNANQLAKLQRQSETPN